MGRCGERGRRRGRRRRRRGEGEEEGGGGVRLLVGPEPLPGGRGRREGGRGRERGGGGQRQDRLRQEGCGVVASLVLLEVAVMFALVGTLVALEPLDVDAVEASFVALEVAALLALVIAPTDVTHVPLHAENPEGGRLELLRLGGGGGGGRGDREGLLRLGLRLLLLPLRLGLRLPLQGRSAALPRSTTRGSIAIGAVVLNRSSL